MKHGLEETKISIRQITVMVQARDGLSNSAYMGMEREWVSLGMREGVPSVPSSSQFKLAVPCYVCQHVPICVL